MPRFTRTSSRDAGWQLPFRVWALIGLAYAGMFLAALPELGA